MKNKIGSDKELFYNNFAENWGKEINNWETNKRLQVVYGYLLSKKILNKKKFLEVGCGMGYFSEKANELGAFVTAVDIGNKLVAMTKKRVKTGKFVVASAAKLPFKNGQFEVLLSTEVVEHVENQQKSISEMSRVLAKGGFIVLTTPNKLYKPFFDFLGYIGIRPYHGNENWLYMSELVKILESHGIKIKNKFYFNMFVNIAISGIKI